MLSFAPGLVTGSVIGSTGSAERVDSMLQAAGGG